MRMPRTAMVLAAGLGKRMRPLTATRPKPLVEVAGATLIDHALRRVAEAGVPNAVVNVHYMADRLEAHLARRNPGLEISISDERAQLLETGGGVARALPLIEGDPFFVVNSDNLWIDGARPSLRSLAEAWDADRMDALLLLVPLARATGYEGQGDFHMDPAGRLTRRRERRVAPYVFSGVQLLARRLFEAVPEGPFSLNLLYDRALAEGRLFGLSHGGLWFHVGTPEAVGETESALAHS
ncbi:MAG: nucleotidyltransferase family protein [Sphingomonadaceae bacterium]